MIDETRRRLTVVLPAYNEEAKLRELVDRLVAAFGELPLDCEIFVVDDGSTDRTAAVAEELSRTAPIRLIRHPKNRGLGAAIRTGLTAAAAEADLVVTMDADNTQDPALIPKMLAASTSGLDRVSIRIDEFARVPRDVQLRELLTERRS
jgi:dolichol-phosphate mannosyltransferase